MVGPEQSARHPRSYLKGRRRFNGLVKAHNNKPRLPLGGAGGMCFAAADDDEWKTLKAGSFE